MLTVTAFLAIAALSLACLAVTVLNLRGGRWWE